MMLKLDKILLSAEVDSSRDYLVRSGETNM